MIFARYLSRLIWLHIGLVLLGFVALFALFDLVSELEQIGKGSYNLRLALGFILMRIPGMAYELIPVATLIGALWALALVAAASEFTVARASGFGPRDALRLAAKVGLPVVLLTILLSELVVPYSEGAATRMRSAAIGSTGRTALQSGYWLRDQMPRVAQSGPNQVVERMVNIRNNSDEANLQGVTLYEFNADRVLLRVVRAPRAALSSGPAEPSDAAPQANPGSPGEPAQVRGWRLIQPLVIERRADGQVVQSQPASLVIQSTLSNNTLGALLVKPEQMSARELAVYSRYLQAGNQDAKVYEQAFWKKVIYPLVVWVMLVLALPAAYLQARGGTVGLKIFLGILVGVVFQLLNSLFNHIGLLTAAPPYVGAMVPSLLALTLGLTLFLRVQRRAY